MACEAEGIRWLFRMVRGQVADELVREVLNPKVDPHTGVQETVRDTR